MAIKYLSYVPTLGNDLIENLGFHEVTDYNVESSNMQIVGLDQVARFHWLPKSGTITIEGDFIFGAKDGGHGLNPAHDLTPQLVHFSYSSPWSRGGGFNAMSDLVTYMETNSGEGNLMSFYLTGTMYVGGSHKYLTDPANDWVVGNYSFPYTIRVGTDTGLYGGLVPRLYVPYNGGGVYNVLFIQGSIGVSYETISGGPSTGLPPGDIAVGVGMPASLFAVPYNDTDHLYTSGYLGVTHSADPVNNPISIGGAFNTLVNTGPDGDMLSLTTGFQNIDVTIDIDTDLTIDI